MLKFIVALAAIFYTTKHYGQGPVFFWAYDIDSVNNFGQGIYERDNKFYLCGWSSGSNALVNYLKIDSIGDIQWIETIDKSPPIGGEDLKLIQAVGNYLYSFGSYYDSTVGKGNIFLVKFDSAGKIKFNKTVDICYNDRPRSSILKEYNLYVTGYCQDSINPTSGDNIFLAKIDTSGSIIWHQEFEYSTYEYPKSLNTTPDGGFLIGGEWINPATQNWDLFLLKLDSAGNALWHKSYGKTNNERYGYATTTLDGGYAIAGYRETNGQPDGLLIKTDSNGVFQWEKLYGKPQQIDLFKILRQDAKGNFILAGNSRDPNAPNTPRAWLMKTNSNGDTLWTRLYSYYGGDSHTYVEDMIQTSDGGYALTGYTIANVPTGNDLWVLKTDSLGRTCDSPPCHGVITGVNKTELLNSNTLNVYPNPTSGIVIVKFLTTTSAEGTLTLYDAQGRIKELRHIPREASQLSLHVDQPPGIYLLKLETDDGRISTTKLIIAE